MVNDSLLKAIPTLIRNHFSEQILNKHCICAIGYGSAIFPQTTTTQSSVNNTIDVILVVNNR